MSFPFLCSLTGLCLFPIINLFKTAIQSQLAHCPVTHYCFLPFFPIDIDRLFCPSFPSPPTKQRLSKKLRVRLGLSNQEVAPDHAPDPPDHGQHELQHADEDGSGPVAPDAADYCAPVRGGGAAAGR